MLRLILSEVEKRRQGKGQETYVVNLQSKITISLTDYSFHIRNDLADALADIDPPELIERIRYCPVCNCLFWAGTSRKKACDKHGDRVRKANNRRDIRQRKTAAAHKRRKEQAVTTLGAMKRTAQAVIYVIMNGARSFGRIDSGTSQELWSDHEFIPSTKVIRQVTHKLHKDGYLDYFESADHFRRDRYYPTQKLIDLWNDSRLRTRQQS
ncbi:MAG TPA: hypothetical protein VJ749_17550 [Pyrinomonadaceae bacterium]|nr:hypothetical protein [Pyrinomonadaceae bacterium]